MYVPCRKCPACVASVAKIKSFQLSQYMRRFKYAYMVTLTYDNANIPTLVDGSSLLYRGCLGFDDVICDIGEVYRKNYDVEKAPEGSSHSAMTAVLWYEDIKNYHKKLRYNLNTYGKRNFKFFCCCEYGPQTKRPHFHIIYMSDDIRLSEFESAVRSSWSMCDWSSLRVSKSFERCENNISNYVASYVSGSAGMSGIYGTRLFRSRSCRSKDVFFTLDAENLEDVQRIVESGNYRLDESRLQLPFSKRYVGRSGQSSRFLSTSVIYSLFPKCEGFRSLSSNAFLRRGFEIILVRLTERQRKVKCSLSSLDYNLTLGYFRFCEFFNLNPNAYGTVTNYLLLYISFVNFYNAIRLRLFMCRYEKLGRDYYLDCLQSWLDSEGLRDYRLSMLCGYREEYPLMSNDTRLSLLSYERENFKYYLGKQIKDYAKKS